MTTTDTNQQPLKHFITAHAVTMTAERWHENANMDAESAAQMDHWRIVLKVGGRRMTTYFSKSFGHHGQEPTTDEVLSCLASDAASVENAQSFEDWCSEFGYDTDSRRAERTYKTIERQAKALRQLLYTADAYESLLYKTDHD